MKPIMHSVARRHPAPRPNTAILLLAIQIAGGLLLVFHGWLLWERMSAGELLQPAVGLRWAAALLLAWAWVAHRQRGLPLLRGRRALVLWLLAALLHWHGGAVTQESAQPTWLLVAPAISVMSVGLIALEPRPRSRRSPLAAASSVTPSRVTLWIAPRLSPHLLPRPPPA